MEDVVLNLSVCIKEKRFSGTCHETYYTYYFSRSVSLVNYKKITNFLKWSQGYYFFFLNKTDSIHFYLIDIEKDIRVVYANYEGVSINIHVHGFSDNC